MQVHELKTWPRHFDAVYHGRKTFEMRQDDRGFHVGDHLYLREWEPSLMYAVTRGGQYTGRTALVEVTYILREDEEAPEFIADGWCIMAIRLIATSIDRA